ncbi:hypothetical protein AWC38_SpisGene10980 [Stylophora pistillata]|uniref:Reverse transcriptase domain-containing protein n=1 Tax=Stylophora pistillata TaxID=50429 RepID=A0A2B4S760_STYPI|nr:hypothetical protein AWC38_SpisGene10980 [Stylophora pistillata]
MNNITSTYKEANTDVIRNINNEAKDIAANLKIDDRAECMTDRQAFITLKDHKDNFQNKPICRLINPAKSEIGRIKKLLTDSINFAKQYINIPDRDVYIIMQSRKSILFNNGTAWIEKDNGFLDVTMDCYDGAEVCELVGLFILSGLCNTYGKESIGLYRDDGLAVFKNTPGPQAERIRKDIDKHFKNHGQNITIQTNLKIVNYLDVTFNLNNGTFYPYRKPNNQPLCINAKSNHP